MATQPADFAQAVERLKDDLQTAITNHLYAFHKATGITPSAVTVRMIEVTTHDEVIRQWQPSNVDLTFTF